MTAGDVALSFSLISNPPPGGYVLPVVADRGRIVEQAMSRYGLRRPVGVFLIVFGLTRIAELLDWSRMHADAVSSLAMGGTTVTALIIAAKAVDLLLTAAALLALVRGHGVWLLVALAGWTAGFAVLTVLAGIGGDAGALVQQGCFFVVFAGLLTGAYLMGLGRPPSSAAGGSLSSTSGRWRTLASLRPAEPLRQDVPVYDGGAHPRDVPVYDGRAKGPGDGEDVPVHDGGAEGQDVPARGGDATREDLPARDDGATRQDLPVRGGVTRQDLPLPGSGATRQDLPVRRRRVAPEEEPAADD